MKQTEAFSSPSLLFILLFSSLTRLCLMAILLKNCLNFFTLIDIRAVTLLDFHILYRYVSLEYQSILISIRYQHATYFHYLFCGQKKQKGLLFIGAFLIFWLSQRYQYWSDIDIGSGQP